MVPATLIDHPAPDEPKPVKLALLSVTEADQSTVVAVILLTFTVSLARFSASLVVANGT